MPLEAPPPALQGQTKEMVCPKCERHQATAIECRYCGVIISKAIKAKPQLPAQRDLLEKAPSPQPSTTGGWQVFSVRCRQFAEHVRCWLEKGSLDRAKATRWSQRIIDRVTRLAITWAIALVLEIGLLYLGNGMWFLYKSTPAGQHYLTMTDSLAIHLQYLAAIDPALLGLEATLTALLVCLVVAAACQLLHVIRLFYDPFGFFVRMMFWTIPLTGAAGWWIYYQDPMIPFGVACVICFVPTAALLGLSVEIVRTVLPELGTVVGAACHWRYGLKKIWDMVKEKLIRA